jgi:hypothetical protein
MRTMCITTSQVNRDFTIGVLEALKTEGVKLDYEIGESHADCTFTVNIDGSEVFVDKLVDQIEKVCK